MTSERTPLLSVETDQQSIDNIDDTQEISAYHINEDDDTNQATITPTMTWPSHYYDGYQTYDYSGATVKRNPKYYRNNSKNSRVNMVVTNYDQILVHIGDIGWWQILNVGLLCLPSIAGGILVLLTNFTALEPAAFRCAKHMALAE